MGVLGPAGASGICTVIVFVDSFGSGTGVLATGDGATGDWIMGDSIMGDGTTGDGSTGVEV